MGKSLFRRFSVSLWQAYTRAMKKIHLARNSKKPVANGFETITDDPAIHQQWIAQGDCIGLMLGPNGLSAVDFDNKRAGREWWAAHVAENVFNVASETAHGIHLVFRGKTRTRKSRTATSSLGTDTSSGRRRW